LLDQSGDDYEDIGGVGFFAMVLRTNLGDHKIEPWKSDFKVLSWFVWILIMLIGNIVLMNFIIAVVNESYESCMQVMKAQTYKVKVDMIKELEQMMVF
jgi:hypothetical protein